MKYLILYAHPNPASFNHGILEVIQEELRASKADFDLRDLNVLGFQPALKGEDFQAQKAGVPLEDVTTEQKYVKEADVIVIIHPIWWFSQPAILRGYIDRHGFAYAYTAKGAEGLLKNKKVFMVNTTGHPKSVYDDKGYGEALSRTLFQGVFGFVGMELACHHYCYGVPMTSLEQRKQMLEEVRAAFKKVLQ